MRGALVLAFVACAVLALVLAWVEPGPLTIDEATYHRMTYGLVHGEGLHVANGYEEARSPELTSMFIRSTDTGELAAQYPYGTAVVGLPLYAAFGNVGPFILSAVAYLLALWLAYLLAQRIFRDRGIAYGGAALLTTTYFSEYALASWPHATAVTAALGAFVLGVTAYESAGRRAHLCCFAAGLVAGLGMTLRLDALFCVPAIAAPFFFGHPTRVKELAALALGLVPGAALIAWTNDARWGRISPLSYGPKAPGLATYTAFGAVAIATTALAWLATRPATFTWIRARKRHALAAGLIAALALLGARSIVHTALVQAFHALHGIVGIAADLRLRPGVAIDEVAVIRFGERMQKAMLQNSPFLVLAVASLRARPRMMIAWLLVVPALVIGFFGAFNWAGGMSLNMRYLLPALPFLCILSARTLRDVAVTAPRGWWIAALLAVLATAAQYAFLLPGNPFSAAREHYVLTLPLVLMVLLVIALAVWVRRPGPATAMIVLVLAGMCVGWSITRTVRDAAWSQARRKFNYETARCVGARVADNALVFADTYEPVEGAVEDRPGIRIAIAANDSYATARELVERQLAHGRRAFAAVVPATWRMLEKHGALDDMAVDTLATMGPFVLGEIRHARPGEPRKDPIIDVSHAERCGPPTELDTFALYAR